MTGFYCDRCGKCCISLGKHISIERKISSTSHYCRVAVTREIIPVNIQPQHREIFSSPPPGSTDPFWCPYLRRISDDEYICTIYPNRPAICRNFRCYSMKVLYGGEEAGRVSGGKNLKTNDPVLKEKWERLIAPLTETDRRAWNRSVKEILEKEGYEVEIVD